MHWTTESKAERDARRNAALLPQWERECKWHDWFAWYPVWVDPNQRAWLRTVERKLDAWAQYEPPEWWNWDIRSYEYRLKPRKD